MSDADSTPIRSRTTARRVAGETAFVRIRQQPGGRTFLSALVGSTLLSALVVGTVVATLALEWDAPGIGPAESTPEAGPLVQDAPPFVIVLVLVSLAATPLALIAAFVVRISASWRFRSTEPETLDRAYADAQGCLAALIGFGPVVTAVAMTTVLLVAPSMPLPLEPPVRRAIIVVAGAVAIMIAGAALSLRAHTPRRSRELADDIGADSGTDRVDPPPPEAPAETAAPAESARATPDTRTIIPPGAPLPDEPGEHPESA